MRPSLLAALTLSLNASAAEIWRLTWNAPEGCSTAAELARSVEERLGHPVFGLHGERHLEGVVKSFEEAPRWRAHVVTVDEHGTVVGSREVSANGDDCRSLDDAVVLVLALTIGDGADSLAPRPPPPAPPQLAAPRVPSPAPPPPRHVVAPVAPVVRGWFGDGGLGVAAQSQLLPDAFSLGVAASVRPNLAEWLFLDFRAAVYPYTPVASAHASTGVVSGTLSMLVGARATPFKHWSIGLAVGAMGSGFLLENRALSGGLQIRGRFDVEARLHSQFRIGEALDWALELGVEGGYSPVTTFVRLVTSAGLPEDLELPAFHFGASVSFVWPMADRRPSRPSRPSSF